MRDQICKALKMKKAILIITLMLTSMMASAQVLSFVSADYSPVSLSKAQVRSLQATFYGSQIQ